MDETKDPKEIMLKVAALFGFCPKDKEAMINTIVAKGVSLFLGILFCVLRSKAKADGKVGKSRVFLVLSILFFVGVIVNRVDNVNIVTIGGLGDNEGETEVFDAEFEDELE